MEKIIVEIPDNTNWFCSTVEEESKIVPLLISGTEYMLPNKVASMMKFMWTQLEGLRIASDHMERAVEIIKQQRDEAKQKAEKELKELKILTGRAIGGETVSISSFLKNECSFAALSDNWDREVKYGMAGWIQANWSQLCKTTCDCGNPVDYESVRDTNKLICKPCKDNGTDNESPK